MCPHKTLDPNAALGALVLRPLVTLQTRAEFQRIRGGVRVNTSAFLLEAKRRQGVEAAPHDTALHHERTDHGAGVIPKVDVVITGLPTGKRPPRLVTEVGPRFGFTITKKIGGAVQRNRIRRRLKDAIRRLQHDFARPGFDYVIVARGPSLDCPFDALMADVRSALVRAHSPGKSGSSKAARDMPKT
jgi:ribonuclease P protein component